MATCAFYTAQLCFPISQDRAQTSLLAEEHACTVRVCLPTQQVMLSHATQNIQQCSFTTDITSYFPMDYGYHVKTAAENCQFFLSPLNIRTRSYTRTKSHSRIKHHKKLKCWVLHSTHRQAFERTGVAVSTPHRYIHIPQLAEPSLIRGHAHFMQANMLASSSHHAHPFLLSHTSALTLSFRKANAVHTTTGITICTGVNYTQTYHVSHL